MVQVNLSMLNNEKCISHNNIQYAAIYHVAVVIIRINSNYKTANHTAHACYGSTKTFTSIQSKQ